MADFKKEVISYFAKNQHNDYQKLQEKLEFDDELMKNINDGIIHVVHDLTNKISNYDFTKYGTAPE